MLAKAVGYGYCLAYVLALSSWPGAAYPANSYRDLDICNHWNGRRHFLELGERGELHARNVSTTAYRVSLAASCLANRFLKLVFHGLRLLRLSLPQRGFHLNRKIKWNSGSDQSLTMTISYIRIPFSHRARL